MKIYTKTGDDGTTSLIGGKRVPKFHERIEVYGTIDELICHVGLLRDIIIIEEIKLKLLFIQDRLMTCAAIIATDCEGCSNKLPKISDSDVEVLENEIDEMEKYLKPLKSFILPGGPPIVSHCHIARTVCRRTERNTLALNRNFKIDATVIRFLNRLSDYLFILARYTAYLNNSIETTWLPNPHKDRKGKRETRRK